MLTHSLYVQISHVLHSLSVIKIRYQDSYNFYSHGHSRTFENTHPYPSNSRIFMDFEETGMLMQAIVAERPKISANPRQKLSARDSAIIARVERITAEGFRIPLH